MKSVTHLLDEYSDLLYTWVDNTLGREDETGKTL